MFPTLFSCAQFLNGDALEVDHALVLPPPAPGEDASGELDWERLEELRCRMIANPAASFCNLCACACDKLSGERL